MISIWPYKEKLCVGISDTAQNSFMMDIGFRKVAFIDIKLIDLVNEYDGYEIEANSLLEHYRLNQITD